MPHTKTTEEINLLLKQLRDAIKDVFPGNPTFDNYFYLYRWLLQNKLSIKQTEKAIRESIEWRKMFKVDELANMEWGAWCPEMNTFCQYNIRGFTKISQPITTVNSDEIDLRALYRKCGKEGHVKSLVQYFAKVEKYILDHYKYGPIPGSQSGGRNSGSLNSNPENETNGQGGYNPSWDSAGAILVGTYKDFPNKNLVFLEGIQGYLEGAKLGMTRFPALLSAAYFINREFQFKVEHKHILLCVNPFANSVLNMVKPILNLGSLNLEVFGTDKNKWSKELLEHIDADQLEVYFGGNMVISEET